jgi:TP901 family phage tail tape measure protein
MATVQDYISLGMDKGNVDAAMVDITRQMQRLKLITEDVQSSLNQIHLPNGNPLGNLDTARRELGQLSTMMKTLNQLGNIDIKLAVNQGELRQLNDLRTKVSSGTFSVGTVTDVQQLKTVKSQLQQLWKEASAAPGAATASTIQYSAALEQVRTRLNSLSDHGLSNTLERINNPAMLGVQARLMMNYAAIGGIVGSLAGAAKGVVDLDTAMHQLQAIAGMTTESMGGLKQEILQVAKNSRFSAAEVADAATVLAQAGFSGAQIKDSLQGVVLIATATGSSLKEAVDIATSAIGVFNMQASEMGQVANTVTAALNLSKLTMDKLAQGLQYAGNIAADNGVSFNELSAALAALSNTGIRSGSTMGTGLRQLLIELGEPTKKLSERFRALGISSQEVDIKANGLTGVLENLRRHGFTAADAFAVMETRTAAAFSALARGAEDISKFERAFLLSTAATEANSVQMDALSAKWERAKTILLTITDSVAAPLVKDLKSILDGFNELTKGIITTSNAINEFIRTKTGIGSFSLSPSLLMLPPTVAVSNIGRQIGERGYNWLAGTSAADANKEALGQVSTDLQKLEGEADAVQQKIAAIDQRLQTLYSRRERLAKPENAGELETQRLSLNQAFGRDGFKAATGGVDTVIRGLTEFRAQLSRDDGAKKFGEQLQTLTKQADLLRQSLQLAAQNPGTAAERFGVWAEHALGNTKDLSSPSPAQSDIQALIAQAASGGVDTTSVGALMEFSRKLQAGMTALTKAQQDADAKIGQNIYDRMMTQARQVSDVATNLAANIAKQDTTAVAQDLAANEGAEYTQAIRSLVANIQAQLTTIGNRLKDAKSPEEADKLGEQAAKVASDMQLEVIQVNERVMRGELSSTAAKVLVGILEGAAGQAKAEAEKTADQARKWREELLKLQVTQLENELRSLHDKLKESLTPALVADYLGIAKTLSEKKQELSQTKGEKDLKQVGLDKSPEAQQLNLQAAAAVGTRTRDDADNAIRQLQEQAANKAKREAEEAYRLQKRVAEAQITVAENQIEEILRSANLTTTDDFKTKLDSLSEASSRYIDLALDEYVDQLKKDRALADRPDLIEALTASKRNDLVDKVIAKQLSLFETISTVITKRAEQELQNLPSTKALSTLDAQSQGRQATLRGRENFTEADRYLEDRKREDLTIQQLKESIVTKQKELNDLVAVQKTFEADVSKASSNTAAIKQRIAEIEKAKGDLLSNAGSDQKEINSLVDEETKLQAKLLETSTSNAAVQKQMVESKAQIKSLTSQIALEQTKLTAMTKNEEAPLTDRITAALKMELGTTKTFNTEIVETVQAAAKASSSAMSTFFKDTISGSKSVKDALKDMVKSFSNSVLDVATKNMANSMFAGVFGNLFGGSSSGSSGGLLASLFGASAGGLVPHYDTGGTVAGTDIGRDSTLAWLRPGEFVLNRSATAAIGADYLNQINFNAGRKASTSTANIKPPQVNDNQVNVWVTTPDQVPQTSESDIVAAVTSDMLRGGSTKALIKNIAMGKL